MNTTDESDYHLLQRFTLPIISAIRNVAEYKKLTATCIERAHLNPQTLYKVAYKGVHQGKAF
jgi:hypothetical protein